MTTLKEIAQCAGVSISTVSRVMNNDLSRHISQETKSKVWKVAKDLGYTPNGIARTATHKKEKAAQKHAWQVGCIVSMPQNKYNHPYFSPILAGIEKKMAELNGTLSYVITLEELQSESAMRRLVQESNLDGIIVVEGIPAELYEAVKRTVPAVVGIDISDPTVPVIMYDRVEAAKAAVRHLLEQGHTDIGFIGGAGLAGDLEREKRYRGYRYALEEAGIAVNPEFVVNTGWDVNVSYSRSLELMGGARHKRPTAIFAASDMMAISAMRAAAECGLHIPQDVAFVGLDNIEVSQYTSPPLSTIHIPKSEIGMMAAKTMIDQLEGKNPLPFKLFMPYQLIVRQSSEFTRT